MSQLWKRLLHQEGDVWDLYHCPAGSFPAPEQAASYSFLLIGGSHYSAYEDVPWIGQLAGLIPQYVQRGARIVGCCFGAQVRTGAHAAAAGPAARSSCSARRLRACRASCSSACTGGMARTQPAYPPPHPLPLPNTMIPAAPPPSALPPIPHPAARSCWPRLWAALWGATPRAGSCCWWRRWR